MMRRLPASSRKISKSWFNDLSQVCYYIGPIIDEAFDDDTGPFVAFNSIDERTRPAVLVTCLIVKLWKMQTTLTLAVADGAYMVQPDKLSKITHSPLDTALVSSRNAALLNGAASALWSLLLVLFLAI